MLAEVSQLIANNGAEIYSIVCRLLAEHFSGVSLGVYFLFDFDPAPSPRVLA